MIIGGLDLETTGLLDPAHRIIECAVILKRLESDKSLSPVSEHVWRIDPRRSIDEKAYRVHHISNADLIGQPTFDEVAPGIVKVLDGCDFVIAHNGMDFDFLFLAQELERGGHSLPDFEPYDTMLNGRWATDMGNVPSLQALCFACGVKYDPSLAHAAKYDVERMLDCFEYGLRRKVFTLPSL